MHKFSRIITHLNVVKIAVATQASDSARRIVFERNLYNVYSSATIWLHSTSQAINHAIIHGY